MAEWKCPEPECDFTYPSKLTAQPQRGFTTYVDDNGTFRHRHNAANWGEAQSENSAKAKSKRSYAPASELGAAVISAMEEHAPLSKADKMVVRQLSRIASGASGTSQVSALDTIASKLLSTWESGPRAPKHPDEPCRLCGRIEETPEFVIDEATFLGWTEIAVREGAKPPSLLCNHCGEPINDF